MYILDYGYRFVGMNPPKRWIELTKIGAFAPKDYEYSVRCNAMNSSQVFSQYDNHVLPTYARYPVAFARGEGCRLFDEDGKSYLDFASGIGVLSVGHAHPQWIKAVCDQAQTLAHVSNLYYHEPGARLAEKLCALSGMQKVFFSNSGAEANEGAIKVARKYSEDKYGAGRSTILTLSGSFHGRTLTTLAATGQDHFHTKFQPLTGGFRHIPPEDVAALTGDDVCAVLCEPILGEGGVLPLSADYLKAIEATCRERDWLFLCDEVQTGIGRTGHWFAHQAYGLTPDVVSFAKGIAGGLPMGGFLVSERVKDVLQPGDHATTFGGNIICCAAALATLEILAPILPKIEAKGAFLKQGLTDIGFTARGKGLMLGIPVTGDTPQNHVRRLLDTGLVALTAGKDAVRLLPPLVISQAELAEGLEKLKAVLTELKNA